MKGLFPKERFRYDGGEDIYICPDGQRLALHSKRKRRTAKRVLERLRSSMGSLAATPS